MKYKQTKLKSAWARFRYFLAVLKCKLFKTNDIVICVLVLNNRCDFDCSYCFGSYHQRRNKDYTTAEIKHIIDELYNLGTRYLTLHGGEALLRRDIGEIIDYVKQKGMYCCLITNGSLLHKKIDQVRIVDNLTISLDGAKENNDLNRGEGTYEKALGAIKLAIQEKIPLRVQATITKFTMNDVGYLAKLAKELGFSLYFSILFKALPKAKAFEMTDAETRAVLKDILQYKNKGYPIFTSHRTLEYAINWPLNHNTEHFVKSKQFETKIPSNFKKTHIKCHFGKNKMTIEADGNVYPCFVTADCFKPLNWKEVGIKKAIQHVQQTDDCVACPTLTQNDHNLLFNLNIKLIGNVMVNQIKETMRQK
jgi:MoaA/NifB/PqqE/SkfB family radical SAM enzyme